MNSQINYHPVGEALQDIAYEYDLVGNITAIHDRSSKCGVADNLPLGEDALDRLFNYDPLYRLCSATGRECRDIPHSRPWLDEPRCGFNAGHSGVPNQDNAPHLTALYREDYAYDPAGNLVMLQHQQAVRSNGGLSWETIETRRFGMGGLTPEQWQEAWPQHLSGDWHDSPGNRLTHLEDRWAGVASPLTVPQTHFFDDNGNLIRENRSRHFEWDHADRLRSFRTQAGDSEPSIHAHYLYDAAGQRVKKLVRKQGGQLAVTVYIDGLFEFQRLMQGGTTYQNNTLHVMDDQSRIATVRIGEPFPDDTAPAVKYHLGDHLGSSNLVINSSGNWVNREEYTPYGETSFGSFARKRYRFSGKERDEESGLYYHGARYYAPWLSKWASCDPAGMVDGSNLYQYVRDNPLNAIDSSGRQSNLISGGVPASGEPLYEYGGIPLGENQPIVSSKLMETYFESDSKKQPARKDIRDTEGNLIYEPPIESTMSPIDIFGPSVTVRATRFAAGIFGRFFAKGAASRAASSVTTKAVSATKAALGVSKTQPMTQPMSLGEAPTLVPSVSKTQPMNLRITKPISLDMNPTVMRLPGNKKNYVQFIKFTPEQVSKLNQMYELRLIDEEWIRISLKTPPISF